MRRAFSSRLRYWSVRTTGFRAVTRLLAATGTPAALRPPLVPLPAWFSKAMHCSLPRRLTN
jgi:hypothetical protein